jgi:hypothetical protein
MKIKNLQDTQNIKKEYRVLDSTHFPDEETKEMIGGIYECANVDYKNSFIALYNQDKKTALVQYIRPPGSYPSRIQQLSYRYWRLGEG